MRNFHFVWGVGNDIKSCTCSCFSAMWGIACTLLIASSICANSFVFHFEPSRGLQSVRCKLRAGISPHPPLPPRRPDLSIAMCEKEVEPRERLLVPKAFLESSERKFEDPTDYSATEQFEMDPEYYRDLSENVQANSNAWGMQMELHFPSYHKDLESVPSTVQADLLIAQVVDDKGKKYVVRMPVLVRGRNFCMDETEANLHSRYDEDEQQIVTCTLQQMAGCLVAYKTQYGILTTYNWLWLVRLDEDGILHVSEGFPANREGKDSLLNAMMYGMALAANSSGWIPPSLPNGFRRKIIYQTRGARDNLNSLAEARNEDVVQATARSDEPDTEDKALRNGTFEIVEEFDDHHEDRVCFAARDIGNTNTNSSVSILKCFLQAEERDREVHLYRRLGVLQGRGIPQLLRPSLIVELEDGTGRQHTLELGWAGTDLDKVRRRPNQASVMNKVRSIVSEMHKLGVVHCDLAMRNIAVHPETEEVTILDLGEAKTLEQLGVQEFVRRCQEDLTDLLEVEKEVLELFTQES